MNANNAAHAGAAAPVYDLGPHGGGAVVSFNPRALDAVRGSVYQDDGGNEWFSRQLLADGGKRDGDWLCFECGWRNWRCYMLCKHCWLVRHVPAFDPVQLQIPLMVWTNGETCEDADTRYRLLDETGSPRRPPRKMMDAAGWKVALPPGWTWRASRVFRPDPEGVCHPADEPPEFPRYERDMHALGSRIHVKLGDTLCRRCTSVTFQTAGLLVCYFCGAPKAGGAGQNIKYHGQVPNAGPQVRVYFNYCMGN